MHIPFADRRAWLQQRLEAEPPAVDQQRILRLLARADIFEQVIQSRYLGTKRFSLEGVTALIPFLDELLNRAAELGAERAIMGMSHRGRLSVMVNTFGKSPVDIFARFEDVDPRSILGGGDVKYHVGATGDFAARDGSTVALHLVSNPSHLEAVDPVAMGRARARQDRIGADGIERVLPVVIHGDAAFAGQGIWAETMNLAGIDGYSVGGGIHIVVNNLIGFTAEPAESNSTRFSTDLAKRCRFRSSMSTPKIPQLSCASRRWLPNIATSSTPTLSSTSSAIAATATAKWTIPPSRSRCATRRIKDHPPLYELYAQQIGVDDRVRS